MNATRQGLIASFLARLATPRLFVLMATLFVFDMLVPDFIPFVDEILLAALTLAFSRRKPAPSPSPGGAASGDLPDIDVTAR